MLSVLYHSFIVLITMLISFLLHKIKRGVQRKRKFLALSEVFKGNDVKTTDFYPNCDVNVWLRSCEKEIITPITGKTKGTIPVWLNGALLRNGPGNLKVGNMEFKHLFDASALLHRFAIKDGKVTYQCRFLLSESYKKNHIAKRIVVTEFGTKSVPDPCQSIFSKIKIINLLQMFQDSYRISSIFEPGAGISDNAMISIYPFGDEYYAMTESPVMHRVDPEELKTLDRVELGKKLGLVSHSSHPHLTSDGSVYNLAMTVGRTGPEYNIVKFPPKSQRGNMFDTAHIVASVPVRWPFNPCYMHTFGITKSYFIIVEQPLSISVANMIKGRINGDPMINSLQWYENECTYIYVVSRATGRTKRCFKSQSFFYLHLINQYEKNDHIILDVCCYKDPSMVQCMYIETMKQMQCNPNYAKMFRGRPVRFALPLYEIPSHKFRENSSSVSNLVKLSFTSAWAYLENDGSVIAIPELLCDLGCETPTINYKRHSGRNYRYFYAISSDVDSQNPGTLIKVDTKEKTAKTWCEFNCYPSEPIFVSTKNPKSEDDGVILSSLVWGNEETNKIGLLVLCARTWCEIGRCVFETPSPAPKCLHGWWFVKPIINEDNS